MICSLNCILVVIVLEFMRVKLSTSRGFDASFDLCTLGPALVTVLGVAIVELKGAAGDPTVGDLVSFCQPVGFGM